MFVVSALTPGGTLSVMRQFWSRLEKFGEVSVIAHGSTVDDIGPAVRIVGGRFGGPMRFPAIWIYFVRMAMAVRRASQAAAVDEHRLVILPQDSLATGAAAALAGRLRGHPVYLMEHGSAIAVHSDYYWRHRIQMRRLRDRLSKPLLRGSATLLYRLCARLVTGALVAGRESEVALRAAGMPADRLRRYHFAVETERFRPASAAERLAARAELGLPAARPVIVSVSRLSPEKGIDLILAATARLATEPAPVLVLAGDGPLRDGLERTARATGVDVRFPGALAPDGVARLLRASDLFVYAGRQAANTPYSVLEAMASGLAVVATTEPLVHAEMLADGRGTAIAVDDLDAMTREISRWIDDPTARRRAGRLARRYIEARHAPGVLDSEVARFVSLVTGDER